MLFAMEMTRVVRKPLLPRGCFCLTISLVSLRNLRAFSFRFAKRLPERMLETLRTLRSFALYGELSQFSYVFFEYDEKLIDKLVGVV